MPRLSLRLQAKLTILCIGLAILPLGALGLVTVSRTDHTILQMAQDQLQGNLRAAHDRFYGMGREQGMLTRALGNGSVLLAMDPPAQQQFLQQLAESGELDLALITDAQGRVVRRTGGTAGKTGGDLSWSPLTKQALAGETKSGIEVVPAEFLATQGLEAAADIQVVETPNARPAPYATERRALMMRTAMPIRRNGQIVGSLQFFRLLNNRFGLIDTIGRELGVTCTVFLDDIRVSTNVKKKDGNRAIGTMVSKQVAESVLTKGQLYVGRAFVVNDWYLAGYEPILDSEGTRVGILYVGIPEAPFRAIKQNMYLQMGAALVLLGLLAVGIGFLFTRRLTKPLQALNATVMDMAQGRLDGDLHVTGSDEIAELGRSVDAMRQHLQAVIGQVRGAAHEVTQRGMAIHSEIRDIAMAAKAQERSVDSTASAMMEMTSTMRQVADSAQVLTQNSHGTSDSIQDMANDIQQVVAKVETLAVTAQQTQASVDLIVSRFRDVAMHIAEADTMVSQSTRAAQDGHDAVHETMAGMDRIAQVMGEVLAVIERLGKSSEAIGTIVEVIDDIAEQTNLLALNAAIEAARAGEHGRGFAVVADEVRKLAERSAKATGEIAELIKGIQKETALAVHATQVGDESIQSGSRLAESAANSLQAIVKAVGQASTLMGHLTQASSEQAAAATQIGTAISHITGLTQQVREVCHHQASGSQRIIQTTQDMQVQTQHVSIATKEQQIGGEQISAAIQEVDRSAHGISEASERVTSATEGLKSQARSLMEAIAFFHIADQAQAPGRGVPEIQLTVSGGARPLALSEAKKPADDHDPRS